MFFWPRLTRLCVVRPGGAKSVPCDRRSAFRCTTVSQRTAICQHQRGNKECDAFRNHGDRLTAWKSETGFAKAATSPPAPPHGTKTTLIQVTLKSRAAQGQPS